MQPEREIMRAILQARKEGYLTQQELAEITGIDRVVIDDLENGIANPTLELLKKLAKGINMELSIEFVSKQ